MLLKVQDKIVFSSKLPKALRQQRGENGCSSSKRFSGFVSAPVSLEKAEAPGKDRQLPTGAAPLHLQEKARLCPLGNKEKAVQARFVSSGPRALCIFSTNGTHTPGQGRWGVSAGPSTPTMPCKVLGRAWPSGCKMPLSLLAPS